MWSNNNKFCFEIIDNSILCVFWLIYRFDIFTSAAAAVVRKSLRFFSTFSNNFHFAAGHIFCSFILTRRLRFFPKTREQIKKTFSLSFAKFSLSFKKIGFAAAAAEFEREREDVVICCWCCYCCCCCCCWQIML